MIAQSHIDVAQSIERNHAVFPGRKRGIAAFFAEHTRLGVVFLRHIEHAHAPVIGPDVVQSLHPFRRVAGRFGQPEPLAVEADCLFEAAFVAQFLAQFSEGDDVAELVSRAFLLFLQPCERLDAMRGTHDTVGDMPFFGRETGSLLFARSRQQANEEEESRCNESLPEAFLFKNREKPMEEL